MARALVPASRLRAVAVLCTQAARHARAVHALRPVSAALLGQALSAGALMAALTKDGQRLNLQLECDGPLRGLFVDATGAGEVRGYVKNPSVDVEGAPGPFRWRPALGNSGFLSVLRDLGNGEVYRSSVELKAMSLADDLNHYFRTSEQVATAAALEVIAAGDEPLGVVAGVLVQALPDGDRAELERLGSGLAEALTRALQGAGPESAQALVTAMFPGAEVVATTPVSYRCPCSKERVLSAIASLGRAELESLLKERGQAVVVCQFCQTRHETTRQDLEQLLRQAAPAESVKR